MSLSSRRRKCRRIHPSSRKPRFEQLETRNLLATITVTTVVDELTANNGSVSLREAIASFNAQNISGDADIAAQNPGIFGASDTIRFNIAGTGVKTIRVGADASAFHTPLPPITVPLTIDGYTQPGASPNTLASGDNAVLRVVLDGRQAGFIDGLVVNGGNSVIRGLVIGGFQRGLNDTGSIYVGGRGILLASDNNVVVGNFVGVAATGTTGLPNRDTGVRLEGDSNRIGGTTPADRNVISGNQGAASSLSQGWGIYIVGPDNGVAANNTVAGNFIGTDITGARSLPNGTGIGIDRGATNLIGGTAPGSRNIISGNENSGVGMDGARDVIVGNYIGTDVTGTQAVPNGSGVTGNGGIIGGVTAAERNLISGNTNDGVSTLGSTVVQGNYIGTDVTGRNALPNQQNGVRLFGSQDATVGGTSPGAGNLIAFNKLNGVSVIGFNASDNAIVGNSIYSSGRLGINLGGLSVVPNDPLDADTGPNSLQNFPVLDAVTRVGATATISGSLNSLPNQRFRIELFSSQEGNPSGFGEGKTFLGFVNVTTDASGNAGFSSTVSTVAGDGFFTATASRLDSLGTPLETSGFSAWLSVAVGLPECNVTTLNAPGILATAILTNDADNPGQSVLLMTGTTRSDVIIAEPRPANPSQIRVKINGKVAGFFITTDVSRIVVFGLAGNDTIIVNATLAQSATLFGDAGNDSLFGGRGDDQLDGGTGNDKVFGGGGNDMLCGGDGQDYVFGGLGDDILGGDSGNDRLYGEAGNDLVLGSDGNDFLYGGAGDDRLYGQTGNDQLFGEAGNDLLVGGDGNDTLRGSAGRDVAIGGVGKDMLYGDSGDDVLIADSTAIDEDDVALQELLAAWNTNDSLVSRMDALHSIVAPEDVTDDLFTDTLYGGLGQDWFIVGTNDKLKDRAKNEPIN